MQQNQEPFRRESTFDKTSDHQHNPKSFQRRIKWNHRIFFSNFYLKKTLTILAMRSSVISWKSTADFTFDRVNGRALIELILSIISNWKIFSIYVLLITEAQQMNKMKYISFIFLEVLCRCWVSQSTGFDCNQRSFYIRAWEMVDIPTHNKRW
jgi:hypothetical protein